MKDISVIVPVYNGAALIERCLVSVLGQTTRYSFEIICVDDGSTDNSVDVIMSLCDDRILLLRQQNEGPAAARNRGAEAAEGRYVAYLDADDYWLDGYVEETVRFLEEHKECVAVNVAQRHLTVSGERIVPVLYEQCHLQSSRGMCCMEPFVIDDFFSFWAEHRHVCTGSAVLRGDVVRMSGGQREDLRVTEDWEFWNYISTFGRWGFIPRVLFVSDGSRVTRNIGWLNKMKVRWASAPTVQDWERRIVAKMDDADRVAFNRVRGVVSRNLTYCQMLDGRLKLSRMEALRYGRYFPRDLVGRCMRICMHLEWTWFLLAGLLRHREYNRR